MEAKRVCFDAEGPIGEILLRIAGAERRSLNKQMQVVLAEWIEIQRTTRPEWFKKVMGVLGEAGKT